MKFSTAAVRTLKAEAGERDVTFFDEDLPGFGLRFRGGNSGHFLFQYKIGTKHRRMTLGKASAADVAKVRKTVEKLHARVKLGQDPASDKTAAQQQASETFAASMDKFLDAKREKMRPGSFREIKRHLEKYAHPLHRLQVGKIVRRDITTVVESVAAKSGAVTANRVRSSLSSFFAWAIQRDLTQINPVIGTEKSEEQSRERVLAPAELRVVWNALERDQYSAIVKLLALTGQRAGEIAGLCRSEIHDDMIVLPKDRTKNKRDHVLPLPDMAADIIKEQPERDGRDMIFGRGDGPFSGWSRCKERLDARITKANGGKALTHWTLHDLRRTFATYAGGGLPAHLLEKLPKPDKELARGLGIQPHVIEAVLNHVSGHKAGVAGIYQRGTYEREKRAALDLWSSHLLAIVSGTDSNITPLRREA